MSEAFEAAVAEFRAAKERADAVQKFVAVLYELRLYEENGLQGTRFVFVYHRPTVDEIMEEVDDDSRFNAKSIFLVVKRKLSAAGDYYTDDGRLANGPPTEGLLRDCLMDCDGAERPANEEWIDVYNVCGGIECEPASASTDESRPHGWVECSDKYGIQIVFNGA